MLSKSKGTFTVTGSTYSPFHQGLKENMDVNGVFVSLQRMITLIFCPGSVTLDRFDIFMYAVDRYCYHCLRGSARFKGLIINFYALRSVMLLFGGCFSTFIHTLKNIGCETNN